MNKKKYIIDELKPVFSFTAELSPLQLEMLAENSVLEEIPARTVLADRVGNCKGLALILSGELKISSISEDGREVTLYRMGKGMTCALSAACILGNLEGYPVKIIAEKETKIVWVSREFINKHLSEYEPFWRFVFKCMADRLYEALEVVDSIAFIPVRKRLAQILLAKSNSGKHPVYSTHEALARELGTAREVISRELKGFERAGIVSLARGRLTITNADELVSIAGCITQ